MFKQWCRYRRYNYKMQRKSIWTLHCTTTIFQISAMTISIPILIKLVVSYSMNQTIEFTDLALMTISYINIEIDDIDHNYQSYRYVVSMNVFNIFNYNETSKILYNVNQLCILFPWHTCNIRISIIGINTLKNYIWTSSFSIYTCNTFRISKILYMILDKPVSKFGLP